MELMTFLIQEKEILQNLLSCLEQEKDALIQENPQILLEIIEEKKGYIHTLDKIEEKRQDMYPNMNLTKMQELGLSNDALNTLGQELKELTEEISEVQETNHLLTQQSLAYTNQMLSIFRGSQKTVPSSYGANGKIGNNKNNTMLDRSV